MAKFLFTLFLASLTTASFYDNPELDLPPKGGTPLDELKAKWEAEVSQQVPIKSRQLTSLSVGIYRHLNLRTPPPRQMPNCTVRAIRHRHHRSTI